MHEAPLPFQPDLAAWSFIALLVLVTVVAGLIALLKQAVVRSQQPVTSFLLVAGILLGLALLGGLTLTGVKTTVVSTPVSDSSSASFQRFDSAPTIAIPTSVTSETKSDILISPDREPDGIIPPVASTVTTGKTESTAKPSLPEWTQQNTTRDGERKIVVIEGGRFASEEEADLHALDEATAVATKEFRHLDPRGQATRLPAHRDEIQRTAIKQRFLENREHDFGKSKGVMYQVWLQLELSPDLGNRIAAPWREAAVNARIRLLAGASIWLTAVMGLLAFAFRWDTARQGRNRTAIFATVLIVAAGSLMFIA